MRYLLMSLIVFLHAATAYSDDQLLLYYYARPPYLYHDANGDVSGSVATPAIAAIRQAGIAFRWVNLSTNRQIQRIRYSTEKGCAVGWFRIPDREAYATFSLPLYRDRATVFLTRVEIDVPAEVALPALLQRADLRLVLKEGFTYGTTIDSLLSQAKTPIQRSTDEHEEILNNLLLRRFDLMLMSIEEAQWFVEHVIDGSRHLKIIHITEPLTTPDRHLMCNRHVPERWLQRINDALNAAAVH